MKKVYIIHGWDGSPDEPLFKWLSSELEKKGFEVEVPPMPNPDKPVIEEWIANLNEVAGTKPDESIIFVGHSIGCQAILRYLEKLNFGFVGGVVLIAPWLFPENLTSQEAWQIVKPWIDTPIHNPDVFKHIPPNKIVAIFSDNDPYVPLEYNKEKFEKGFGAKIIIEKGKGHFTAEDGVDKLPSALNAILEME